MKNILFVHGAGHAAAHWDGVTGRLTAMNHRAYAIPRTFIRCSEDRTVPPPLQDRMIREADAATPGNPFDVASSHSPFASMPDRLAATLDAH